MPLGRYELDRESGLWIDPTDPTGEPRTLEDVTEGRFTQRGDQVFYQEPRAGGNEIRQYVGTVARSAGSSVTVTNDGGVFLTNMKPRYELDQESAPNTWVQGVIQGDVQLPTGEVLNLSGDRVTLAPEGELVYVRSARTGQRSDFARPGDTRLQEGGFRPATPQELLDRGRVAYLVNNFADELRAFGNSDAAAEAGLRAGDVYGIARWVAANIEILGSVTRDLTAMVGL